MIKKETIDIIPTINKAQNNPIDSSPWPRKVILNINVVTVSIRVIRPGVSIVFLARLVYLSSIASSSLILGMIFPTLGINFQSKNKNKKENGIALKN
ncbi:MAG: hypothetical protein ACJ70N_04715, partial [Nitrososphaera sp.]